MRSPTPAKTEYAGVLLGDVADQLLDDDRLADAGAAEDADLAALAEGAIRSMTLRPVSKTSTSVDCSSNGGGARWIGSVLLGVRPGPCCRSARPSTLKTRPSVASPTGTVIGRAGVARGDAAREAVGRSHRDRAHPVVAEVLLHLADEARLPSRGRSRPRCRSPAAGPAGNSTSTTGPMTWTMRPVLAAATAMAWCLLLSVCAL